MLLIMILLNGHVGEGIQAIIRQVHQKETGLYIYRLLHHCLKTNTNYATGQSGMEQETLTTEAQME